MSVKLISVALLVTVVAADATVKTTMCAQDAPKADTCACTDPTTQEYATTCPDKADENGVFWKADSCDDSTDAFVVKGYRKAGCAAREWTFKKTCTRYIYYRKAECKDNIVSVYFECSSDKCDADSCISSISFAANACHPVGSTYYRLMEGACPTDGEIIVLQRFTDATCTTSAGRAVYPTTCTGNDPYIKSTCTPGENGKITITQCDDSNCTSCYGDSADIPLKTYNRLIDGSLLYLESCKAEDTEYTFQVYAGVQQYSKTCTAVTGGYAMAACDVKTTTTDTTTETTTENSTTEITIENITTTTDVIAPAHTVGVLALALCLLACVY